MTRIPDGVRDLLFSEAARQRAVEAAVAAVFDAAGYAEVAPPTLEFLNVLAGATRVLDTELYKLVDRRGRVLALRPEFTTPIARLVATHFDEVQTPLRIWYAGQVFRCEEGGRSHEFRQMGVELIQPPGSSADATADAEVLRLAARALEASGLHEFTLAIGHVDVLEGLWDGAGLSETAREPLRAALVRRDHVAYEQAVLEQGLPAPVAEALVNAVVAAPSDPTDLLNSRMARDPAWSRAGAALDALGRLLADLRRNGAGPRASADLALVRDFRYYTGIVFQAFAPGAGAPVLGGGRYDNLLGEFGRPRPATGFALHLDRVLGALPPC